MVNADPHGMKMVDAVVSEGLRGQGQGAERVHDQACGV